ncbi:MAG: hypothetical protein GXY76_04880 [Chloroflexi bacterium]|nr:hypothetical protein [Chloroflexota bacterium]
MDIYRLKPDDDNWEMRYGLLASHKWHLPGVKCPRCGTWAVVGVAYPAVDLSVLSCEAKYRKARAASLEEYQRLRDAVLPLVPKGSLVVPGTSLGPLTGEARGRFGSFAWIGSWTMLVQAEVIPQLEAVGVKLPVSAPAELHSRAGSRHCFVEFQLMCDALLAAVSFRAEVMKPPCSVCGREAAVLDRVVVEESTVPREVDLFRPRNHPAVVLATERFADAARQLGLTNIVLERVDVTD